MKKYCGIYKIQNVLNGKYYIGSSNNIYYRIKKHFQLLRRKKHHSIYLQNAYNKYGNEKFIFGIIEECSKDKLLIIEQQYFDNIINWKNSYNMSKIAKGSSYDLSTHPNQKKIRENISKSSRGRGSKPFYFKEKRYEKLLDAANELGVDIGTISYRIKNWKNKNYHYENKPKIGGYDKFKYSCYKYTPKKERVIIEKKYYCNCGNEIDKRSKFCKSCAGKNSHVDRPIIVNGKNFKSTKDASSILKIDYPTLLNRIKSNTLNFKDYHYIDKPKNIENLLSFNDIQEKIYRKRNNNKPILIDSIEYFSVGLASKTLMIPPTTIRKRIKSNNFNNYSYL